MTLEFRLEPTKKISVIIASARAKRPNVHRGKKEKKLCPFDAGNEALTPQSTLEVATYSYKPPNKVDWQVRAMENKFPFLSPKVNFEKNKGVTGAFGVHEVIVETPSHSEQFENFSKEQLQLVFQAYVSRFGAITKTKGVEYTYLFKNHGKLGGASIDHEHSQVVGLPFIPEIPLTEFTSHNEKICAYCALAISTKNIVFQNAEFAVVHPSFSRFGLECWIIPKKHVASFVNFDKRTAALFMEALQETIRRIKHTTQDYNVAFHASCKNKKIHFHVEVYPRTATYAGLELGAGIIVNTIDEKAALKILRNE
ncbi:MAG: DUF4931 domain-containing protein [Candidatus Micrarchaeota archaeon]|nr:DUF4931 domain-containing protein [Candidatus Micrarchaeota archaeon]